MKKIIFSLLTLISINSFALTVDGISFDEKVNVAGKDLMLNGVGIRKATFLKIKVYYGGLYLTQKTKDSSSFLNSTEPKQIVMHFVRDVEAKDLKKTYTETFEKANGAAGAQKHKASLDKLLSHLSDVEKNDRMVISFLTDGVVLNLKGKAFDKIGDADFSRSLLNIWFINPADENLSASLLGK